MTAVVTKLRWTHGWLNRYYWRLSETLHVIYYGGSVVGPALPSQDYLRKDEPALFEFLVLLLRFNLNYTLLT